jgi:hypothetical protein
MAHGSPKRVWTPWPTVWGNVGQPTKTEANQIISKMQDAVYAAQKAGTSQPAWVSRKAQINDLYNKGPANYAQAIDQSNALLAEIASANANNVAIQIAAKQAADKTAAAVNRVQTEVNTPTVGNKPYVKPVDVTPSESLVVVPPAQQIAPEAPAPSNCFIATAAFGSPLVPEVETLRRFRHQILDKDPVGKAFVRSYYVISPPIARGVSKSDTLKGLVRGVLGPLISTFGR